MKQKIITKPLAGFMELLPAEQIVFNNISDIIRRSYELFGFTSLDTPILERSAVLLTKAGGETEKQIYRFTKGNSDLAMRFDHTVPLARYIAEHYSSLTFPFRRYTIGKVFRGERSQAGRFREFYQGDIDVIGNNTLDLNFDAEIPSIIYFIFRQLGFERFIIRINNRKILTGFFAGLGVNQQSTAIMQAVDRLDKIGADNVRQELDALKISARIIDKILQFINLKGSNAEIFAKLRQLDIDDEQFKIGLEELSKVIKQIENFGVPQKYFKVDLSIARGLDYYTGTVYETNLDDYPEIGSVCSGGRYDNLADHFISRTLPGVGISIGLTRLFDQLCKKDFFKIGVATLTRSLVIPLTENNLQSALALATKLRNKGIATEVSLGDGKIKKHLAYANKLGIPFAIFIGDDEESNKIFTIKEMATGLQEQLKLDEIIKRLK